MREKEEGLGMADQGRIDEAARAADLVEVRRRKLSDLRAGGVDPYPPRFRVSHHARELVERSAGRSDEELEAEGPSFVLAGRIMSRRVHGKSTFCHIQDRTGSMQLYFRREKVGEEAYALLQNLDIGDFIGVEGSLFRTRTGELTILISHLQLLAKSLRPLPEKWHGLRDVEARYRQRYMDLLMNPEARRVFQIRSRLVQAVRRFFDDRDFLEVETPMMQPIPGGAAARPFVTHHNALDLELYLRIAPELYLKRLVVGGLERVYELNRNFRNEGISRKHNPEFTMLEFYMAYADYKALMSLTEEMMVTVAEEVLGGLRFRYQDSEIDLTPPWPLYTYCQALTEVGGIPEALLGDPAGLRRHALEEHGIPLDESGPPAEALDALFEKLVEPKLVQPTLICDYPLALSPLAKKCEGRPELVERFELFVATWEIANAYSELNDPTDQRERFEVQARLRAAGVQEAHWMDLDYIRALEYGMPPTAGEGVGIDRLAMLFTDSANIRDVILFPLLKPEADA